MNVLLAAAAFSSGISGVQRHALNLTRCLLHHPDVSALHLVVAPWQLELLRMGELGPHPRLTTHVARMDKNSRNRNFWYYRRLPALAARLRADVVHLSYPVPVHAGSFACPTVVSLHDLYPYEVPLNFGFPKCIFNRLLLRQCLRNVDAIACVSEITTIRLRQYAPHDICRKAARIYNCVEAPDGRTNRPSVPGWQEGPFLLCVAQHRRNKNISLLILAFHRLLRLGQIDPSLKLAIVGIAGPETRRIHRLVADCGLSHNIFFLEGLSQPELQWCYAQCEALIAPSSTEGFGLPVAEALLAGCPVVCSDIPAHREVGDGHCRFFALGRKAEERLATAIVETLKEPPKASITFPQLSGTVLAQQYVDLYRGLIAARALARNAAVPASVPATASQRQVPERPVPDRQVPERQAL